MMPKLLSYATNEATPLERMLWWHGQFRRRLEPLRVTPLQAGVLLFLRRHDEATLGEAAAALYVRQPTLTEVVKDLVKKRWVTKQYSASDSRALCLRLSPKGALLARKIQVQMQDVESDPISTKKARQ